MTFTAEQLRLLNTEPDPSLIAQRKKQGQMLSYIEGHDMIDTANAIFGFDCWGYVVTRLEQVGTIWYATVRLTVRSGGADVVEREDVGVGLPAAKAGETPVPDAVETAIKASVTDALKRCLRTFGAALGNELYGKDGQQDQRQPQPAARPAPARAASADLGAVPPDQRWAALKRLLDAGPLRGKQQVDWTHGQVTDLGYSKLLEMAPEAWAELVRRAGDVRLATKQQ